MTASQHDYEEDIRKLMEDMTAEEVLEQDPVDEKSALSVNERKATVRHSGRPVATALSDLPLILSDVPYEPLGSDPAVKDTVKEVELILSADETVSGLHAAEVLQEDFNEEAFIRQYINAQTADNEAGGYDDARRASFFGRQIIRRGDAASAVLSKLLFWTIIAAFVSALLYGLYVLGVEPHIAARQEQELVGAYDSNDDGTIAEYESGYPKGMLASFRGLYDINPQVRGYIQYHAAAAEDFLQINYPVVFGGDNVTYKHKNFYGDASSDGALFIDERCGDEDTPLTIIHGKNAANGKMFAGLNTLVGSVYSARAASRFTYNTLFEKGEYQVFAVVLTDKAAADAGQFDCTRTDFSSDEELDLYLDAVKARSLFDYGVNVSASDDILVLVTGASPSVAKINNATLAVYARRIDGGAATDSLIVKNDDVIMPYSWYTAQKLKPHPYYSTVDAPSAGTTTNSNDKDNKTTSDSASSTTPAQSGSTTAVNTPDTTGAPNNTTTTDTPNASNTQTTARPTAPIGGGEDGVIEMDQLI